MLGKPYDWSCFNIPDESVSLVGVAARILAQEKRRQIVQTRCLTGKQIPSFNKVANRSVDVYTFENIDLKKTSVDTSCLHQRRQSAHIPITMYGVRFEYGRIPEQYIDDLEKYLTPGMVCRDHMKIICAHRVRMNAHSLHDFLV